MRKPVHIQEAENGIFKIDLGNLAAMEECVVCISYLQLLDSVASTLVGLDKALAKIFPIYNAHSEGVTHNAIGEADPVSASNDVCLVHNVTPVGALVKRLAALGHVQRLGALLMWVEDCHYSCGRRNGPTCPPGCLLTNRQVMLSTETAFQAQHPGLLPR